MKKITSKEIQQREYNILKEFNKFAKEHNLKYFLSGGTMLGAVRHQGFIPWDDDIDICMLREDYDKLINLVKDQRMLNRDYKFCLPLDNDYIYPYTKVIDTNTIVYEKDIKPKHCLGVWLDIFPIDACPEKEEDKKMLLKKHARYKFFNKICVAGNLSTTKKKIIAFIGKFGYKMLFFNKDSKYWIKKMLDLLELKDSKYFGNLAWPNQEREIFVKEIFDEVIYWQFEDDKYPIPAKYDAYLTKMYGNYMQLPKEEDRIIHDFDGYIINE